MRDKKSVVSYLGLILGIAACVIIWKLNIPDLSTEGQKALALIVMTIIWWTTSAMPAPFSSAAVLLCFTLALDSSVVPASSIFTLWITPIAYLVISGFLIAEAIKRSGLAKRLALWFIKTFIRSYNGIIISCYLLGLVLSVAIPHPWPRSFLILSFMPFIVEAANLDKKWFAPICLAIFAGSAPTSMIFFTGDSTMNPLVSQFAGYDMTWTKWFVMMGVPGIVATVLMCITQIKIFGKPKEFALVPEKVGMELKSLGKISPQEIKCAIVVILALLMWVTDSLHGIHPGWIALGAVVLMALPFMKLIDPSGFSSVNVGTLLFMTAAMGIGAVASASGLSQWLVDVAVPGSMTDNPFLFAIIACLLCMVLHMLMGTSLTVLIITSPILVAMAQAAGMPAVTGTAIAYIALSQHWILPFHSMTIVVGMGAHENSFSNTDAIKLGIPQTITVFVIAFAAVAWWKLIGII